MPCLTREQFGRPVDLARLRVDLPEFGEGAYLNVRKLKCSEIDAFAEKYKGQDADFVAYSLDLLAVALVDDDGNQLCRPGEDARWILDKSLDVFTRLSNAALKHGGLSVEEPEKKSGLTSPSGSASSGKSSTPTTSTDSSPASNTSIGIDGTSSTTTESPEMT